MALPVIQGNQRTIGTVSPVRRLRPGQKRRSARKATQGLETAIAQFTLPALPDGDEDLIVRLAAAQNPRTTTDLLLLLAADADVEVRLAVADNPRTPSQALYMLAGDSELIVRSFVACNENTPEEVLALLAQDPAAEVRITLATNPAACSYWDNQ